MKIPRCLAPKGRLVAMEHRGLKVSPVPMGRKAFKDPLGRQGQRVIRVIRARPQPCRARPETMGHRAFRESKGIPG